jgi:lia operon protein LiaG
VNGDITVEALLGPVRAATVNGDVRAMIRGFAGPGDVNLTTVNGDAFVELPAALDAVVDGHTVVGQISTDFPLSVTGKFASHALTGTLGTGGRKIHLTTVTGDVEVRKVDTLAEATTPVTPTPPTSPQGTRRPRPGTP